MRIISKFHDYYDTSVTMVDMQNVYVREKKEIEVSERNIFVKRTDETISKCLGATCVIRQVFFCGKYYFYLTTSDKDYFCIDKWKWVKPEEQDRVVYTDFDQVKSKAEKLKVKSSIMKQASRVWDSMSVPPVDMIDLNKNHNAPVILLEHKGYRYVDHAIILNAELKSIEFQRIVDPWSAFQDIERYMANDLAEDNKPPVEIADEYRIKAHGYNDGNFRKSKDTRKRKQKKSKKTS